MAKAIRNEFPNINLEHTYKSTIGDADLTTPLNKMPNNGVFTVELNDIKVDNYKMSVKNVLGQNVYLSFNELTPLSVEHIDLSNLESGVYILEISNSETKFSEKIVIE